MLGSFLTGLSIASILLLVALGLVIVYGSMGVINMAHGELIMLGAYTTVVAQQYGISFLLCLPIAFFVAGLIGFFIERIVVRHLYGRLLDTLLATWGVGIVIQQLVRLTFGPGLQNISVPSYLSGNLILGGVNLQPYRLAIFAVAIASLGAVTFILYKTDFGTCLRAVTQNPQISACNGINVDQIKGLTFALGSGLAGIAGVMVGGLQSVSPTMGTSYVVDSFIVVVVGGVSSLIGAVASSALLGQVNAFVAWASNDVIAKAVLFAIAIVIIRFRPQGLFTVKSR
ncbi:urea ABC transporter permease subunit UrtB [Chroococcidiopsis sp. TS-821]|uniref:urea ABC transporter permease subunit UrtB n=1 Tax=Chroococcidiopsis sp. TS-821 TaxID=1378066 RepID=UPI000CEE9EFE|nr:urea ABC transporter permease subunit UrtB [Chroococcidiopsis sp. TS-821]PPS41901.1 urea ABC transporter permease subunit UrtB [Chroococcidiopsis sp. TS-821]